MARINIHKISIVHWYPDLEKHKCGYCKNENGAVSYGMWAEQLTVEDYQNLIDRGWRRSGMYCYKPIMEDTCCPQYTIRCNALEFQLSKSQKKIIKKFNRYVSDGLKSTHDEQSNTVMEVENHDVNQTTVLKHRPNVNFDVSHLPESDNDRNDGDNDTILEKIDDMHSQQSQAYSEECNGAEEKQTKDMPTTSKVGTFKKGEGADPSKPPCKKARLLRLEKKQEKLVKKGMSLEKLPTQTEGKSLEEFLLEIPSDSKYKIKLKLVPARKLEDELENVRNLEYQLYKKYQTIIHNDPPEKCSISGFIRFLISSPLPNKTTNGPNITFGTFHQQYWLDDKLIAVAVLDILPKCVSSVYFFYDPDYRFLTLGTYASLREIYLTKILHQSLPSIEYYYMGYYIHTCPKMHYKGKLNKSYLLCPETYKWFAIDSCIRKLHENKYCRFNEDIDDLDENSCTKSDVDQIKIFYNSTIVLFRNYKLVYGEEDVYENIGRLIGKKCASNLLFASSV